MRVFLSDDFSLGISEYFGRAIANRRLIGTIMGCDLIEEIYCFLPKNSESEKKLIELVSKEKKKLVFIASSKELLSLLKKDFIDVVFCSDFVSNYPEWVELRSNLKLNFSVFGFTHSLSYQRFTAAFFQILLAPSCSSDRILCTSTSAISVMEKLFENAAKQLSDSSRYLENKPQLNLFPLPLASYPDFEQHKKKKNEKLKVLYIGRFDWLTKMDLLPLADLVSELSDMEFYFVGGGDNLQYVELVKKELQLSNCEILVNLPEDEKTKLLEDADIFISPTDNYQETFGLAVIEAMSYGLVPVVSDFDGYRDLLENKVSGFLVPTVAGKIPADLMALQGLVGENIYHGWWAGSVSYDPAVFIDRLKELRENPELLDKFKNNARARAKLFSQDQCSDRLNDILSSLDKASSEESPLSPFLWDFSKPFSKHPSEWWSDQEIFITEKGQSFLKKPFIIHQFAIYGNYFDMSDLRKLLFLVKRKSIKANDPKHDIPETVFSIALKNGLIGLLK